MAKKMTDAEKAEAAKKRAAKAKAEADASAGPKGDVISVKTKRGVKSRWRAGYQFGPEAREIPLADLSEGKLEALEADPLLVVQLGE